MAAGILVFLKKIVCSRSFQNIKCSVRIHQYSTGKALNSKEKAPVKFSTSPAGKMSIAESIGLVEEPKERKIKRYVVVGSLAVFLVYFCIFREENDLDEALAGNPNYKSNEVELIELRLKLAYCEKNHLPSEKIKAKIEEIVQGQSKK